MKQGIEADITTADGAGVTRARRTEEGKKNIGGDMVNLYF
jgi:hypothetical protein